MSKKNKKKETRRNFFSKGNFTRRRGGYWRVKARNQKFHFRHRRFRSRFDLRPVLFWQSRHCGSIYKQNIRLSFRQWLSFGARFFSFCRFFFFRSIKPNLVAHTIVGAILFLISSLGAMTVIGGEKTGGYIGYFVSLPLLKVFDFFRSALSPLSV